MLVQAKAPLKKMVKFPLWIELQTKQRLYNESLKRVLNPAPTTNIEMLLHSDVY